MASKIVAASGSAASALNPLSVLASTVPGSHRLPLSWFQSERPEAVLSLEVCGDELERQELDQPYSNSMPAGWASLHADLLVHSSEQNHSRRRRCGLTLRFCASDCRLQNPDVAFPIVMPELGGSVVHCRGDPGPVWGAAGMHVGRPAGEDWGPLRPSQ